MMKDRSILSALKDGEIHSPFREQFIRIVEESEDLKAELGGMDHLSNLLKDSPEPDFGFRKDQILSNILQKTHSREIVKPLTTFPGKSGGFWLSWPLAAAAAFVVGVGALAGGYALRSSGLEITFNPPASPTTLALQEPAQAEYRTQKIPEIRVTVPKRFTLPAEEEGELLLSSFEGGR